MLIKSRLCKSRLFLPVFIVFFLVGCGSDLELPDVSLPDVSLPDVPSSPTASSPSYNQIDVTWTQLPVVGYYRLSQADSENGTYTEVYAGDGPDFELTDLAAGTRYFFKLQACLTSDLITCSKTSLTASITTATLSATAPTATAAGYSQFNIAWSEVAEATYYRLLQASGSDGNYSEVYSGSDTSYSSKNLTLGLPYAYKVMACYDETENSCSVSSTAASISSSNFNAATPNATLATYNNAYLSWNSVTNAVSYRILQATEDNSDYAEIYAGSTTNYSDTQLNPSTTYAYKMQVCFDEAANNCSNISSAASITTPSLPATPSMTANTISDDQVDLSWNEVASANYYRLTQATEENGSYTQIYAGADTSFANTGLTAGTTYYYQLKACLNSETDSCSSLESVNATSLLSTPSVSGSASRYNQINLNWDAVPNAAYYRLAQSTTEGGTYTEIYTGEDTLYSSVGLTIGTAYYYQLKACLTSDSNTCSEVSATAMINTLNLSATAPTVLTSANNNQVEVNWSTVVGATTYQLLQTKTSGGSSSDSVLYVGNRTSYSIMNLDYGTEYTYQIKACFFVADESCSEASAAISIDTDPVLSAPSAPLSSINYNQVALTWPAVTQATYYRLSQADSAEGTYTEIYAGDNVTYSHQDLTPNTAYYYKLQACYTTAENSCSPQSASVEAITTALPATPSVSASVVSYKQINLSWEAVEGAGHYRLLQANTENGNYELIYAGSGTSYEDAGLSETTTYYYQLKACLINEAASCSASSTTISATTLVRPPPVVNITSITQDAGVSRQATVTVTLIDYENNASVDYATSDGEGETAAVASTDYTATSGTLNFVGGANNTQTFTIPLLPNTSQDNKTFDLTLSNPNNLNLGDDNSKTITLGVYTRYTKLASNGDVLSMQDQAWSNDGTETLGTQWSCVVDNSTAHVWEVKNNDTSNIHYKNNTYNWSGVSEDWGPLVNGSNTGDGLCGYTNWRVPSENELRVIKVDDNAPTIDNAYFPNTQSALYWTSTSQFNYYRYLDFTQEGANWSDTKNFPARVRLVRSN